MDFATRPHFPKRRALIGLVCSLAALTIYGPMPSVASAAPKPKPYVLKHPGRESCKAKFQKKAKRVNVKKRAGKTVRVRKVFCVPRKPAPAKPQPAPAPPATQAATATTLTAKSRVCENTAFGSRCPWVLVASVSSGGVLVAAPTPVPHLAFTNPTAPGQTWTTTADVEVAIHVQTEQFMGSSATSIIRTTIGPFGEAKKQTIANTTGQETWNVTAIYVGSPTHLGSASPLQALPFGASSIPG